MKTFFLILDLLTDGDAIRAAIHSCFNAAVVSVAVLSMLGAYQVFRRACLRRDSETLSRA